MPLISLCFNGDDITGRMDDSKRRLGPRGDQGAIVQPAATNPRGSRLTSKTTPDNISSSNSLISKAVPAETEPNSVLSGKDSANPNQIRAIGVLDQYAHRPT